ncbi:MAG: CDP-diglyceride synthase [Wigglesworthia glossinidia]|nr:CDP-diglyceride synthase [Wigglesworthia glossinidia]
MQQYVIYNIVVLSNIWWVIAFIILAYYPISSFLWKNKTLVHLIIGWCIIIPLFSSLLILYQFNTNSQKLFGSWMIVYILTLISCLDSGAYLFGKLFGKNKISKIISPNKTWEGIIGGVVLSYISAYLFYKFKFVHINITMFFILSSFSIIFGILGDLVMSMFKRYANIKNSGFLIPGHGGVLDRLDSLSASIPIYTYFILMTMRIS